MKEITTFGVYNNGEIKVIKVPENELKNEIEYNKTFRPGRAYFVESKCVIKGYLSDIRIKFYEEYLVEYLKYRQNEKSSNFPNRLSV